MSKISISFLRLKNEVFYTEYLPWTQTRFELFSILFAAYCRGTRIFREVRAPAQVFNDGCTTEEAVQDACIMRLQKCGQPVT